MVFPAAIREKSQRGVALSCDAHVMSAKSGKIRQPCTETLGDSVFERNFFNKSEFLHGKLTAALSYPNRREPSVHHKEG